MEERSKNGIELEIREHSDADYFPKKCPFCHLSEIKRHTYKIRIIQDLGAPHICRRVRYERVYFKCKSCKKVFGIEHPLINFNSKFMPGVIQYAVSRILERGDSIRRVTKDLNELHHVEVSIGTVQMWINERGEKEKIGTEFADDPPPDDFSGFLSVDGTFKSVNIKKNDLLKKI
jgi:transposase